MLSNYKQWLAEQKYADNTQTAQLHRIKKVEEAYGNLDDHFKNDTYNRIVNSLTYSAEDERSNKVNPSKIIFSGNIRNNLQSYKDAALRYKKFLDTGNKIELAQNETEIVETSNFLRENSEQKFSLERDMQAALRRNITSLGRDLTITDEGAERAVASGFIDIMCSDGKSIVVIELKAGTADSRAIGQILGYMGDLQDEEQKPVRGILIAHSFDRRAKSAATVVPTLDLMKYSIEFKFTSEKQTKE